MITRIICTLFLIDVVVSDFYVGMFEKEDYLVSREFVFKQATPGTRVTSEYGRLYKCPITYIHVKDRVDMLGGPIVKIVKGGLRSKFFVMRITSPPNLPVSVEVSVACPSPHGPVEKEGINANSTVDYDAGEDIGATENGDGASGNNNSPVDKDAEDGKESGDGAEPPESGGSDSSTTEPESSTIAAQEDGDTKDGE